MNVFLRKCPLQSPCFVFEKMSFSIPVLLVMLLAHVGKGSNSRCQMFFKTAALKNFAIFTGKNLSWSLFLIKFQDKSLHFYLIRDSNTGVFSVNIAKFLRTAFLLKTCSLYIFEIFIWWYIIDILELYFTIVKLGQVTERTSQYIDQNLFFAI